MNLKDNSMKEFKLGFGPMSREIAVILAKHSKEYDYPLMIIASRNQVDYDSGYVCTTRELAELLKPYKHDKLLICRDHCGPYFSSLDSNLTLADALVRCKKTIQEDINCGFDLIHIDVSKVPERHLEYATELIDFTLNISTDIKLEFGSEDNTGVDLESSIGRIAPQLEFLAKYNKNVKFFVTQTGSLTKESQVGSFDVNRNQQVAVQIHNAGFLFKEHNADYFNLDDIELRHQVGIDSLNIAPQLGKVQTDLLKEMAPPDRWAKFADMVYSKKHWQRWVNDNGADKDLAVSVSGHYCFNSTEYVDIIASIDSSKFITELTSRINTLLEFYKTFDKTYDRQEAEFQKKLRERLEELRRRDPFIYR